MNEEPRVGLQVLLDRALNKGTAFSADERSDLHLEGLLPAAVDTLDLQVERALDHLAAKPTDLEQYIYLQELCDRNSTLFYALLMSDPARFIPIVYDPTIADACLTYGHIYRRPQGMYLTKKMQGRFAQVLTNWPTRDIRFICVTSGGRILGLGDIGANGCPHPDRQAPALHSVRCGAARMPVAHTLRHRDHQRRAPRRPALHRASRHTPIRR